MSFKLTKETDSHYIVTHPHGSFLKIAKKGLSPDLHETIKKMSGGGQVNPKLQQANLADGGKVEEKSSEDSGFEMPNSYLYNALTTKSPDAPASNDFSMPGSPLYNALDGSTENAPQPETAAVGGNGFSTPDSSQSAISPQVNQNPAQSTPNNPSEANPYQGSQLGKQLTGLGAQFQKGAGEHAAAEAQAGNESANALNQGLDTQQKFTTDVANAASEMHQHLNSIAEELNSGQLDFNRVWHNADTGQKLTAGIGMLLSGLGSGLVNQPNMAHQIINETIDRDIKSQIANQDKKKTAFGMYKEIFGNDMQAAEAARLGGQAIVATKLQQIAQKSRGPLSAADMKMKSAPFMMQLDEAVNNWAMQQAQWKYMTEPSLVKPQGNTQQISTSPGLKNSAAGPDLAGPGGSQGSSKQEKPQFDVGRTGQLDLQRMNGLRLLGKLPKEAEDESKNFEEAQATKSKVLNDLLEMKNQIKSHPEGVTLRRMQEGLGKAPLVGEFFHDMGAWGGEGGRRFAAAKASAGNHMNVFFSKRIGGEGLRNVNEMLPDQGDSESEINEKISNAMKLFDEHAPTHTLESLGLLK